jgi:hypothetical protein
VGKNWVERAFAVVKNGPPPPAAAAGTTPILAAQGLRRRGESYSDVILRLASDVG